MSALLRPASGDFDAPGRTEFVARALIWVSPLVARLHKAHVEVEATPLPAAESHAIVVRRAGLGPRAALVLEIDEQGMEAALELPAAAPETDLFRNQLHRAASAERVFAALAHLPEPFAIAVRGEEREEATTLSSLDVMALETLISHAIEEGRRVRIGWRIARDLALAIPAGDPSLDEQLEGALAALAVPFALLLHGDGRLRSLFRHARPNVRKRKRRELAVGARVRVLTGPFEGKEAIVAELDGRGGARIRIGLLATRIAVREVDTVAETIVPERPAKVVGSAPRVARPKKTAGRPALGSSHRRR